MTLKDKLEIGLKPDAPYRQDNLPDAQQDEPECIVGSVPGDDPDVDEARKACDQPEELKKKDEARATLKSKTS